MPELTKKQANRQKQIISAALQAWQRTDFTGLAMHTVAEELGCSKPALYRYFRSKDDLITQIQSTAVERILFHGSQWLTDTADSDLHTAVDLLITAASRLFSEHPGFLHCVMARRYFLSRDQRTSLRNLAQHMQSRLAGVSDTGTAGFLLYSVSFWKILQHFIEQKNIPAPHTIDDTWIQNRCLYGLAGSTLHDTDEFQIDFGSVEKAFLPVGQEARREPHRIFSAVEEIVAEAGMENATVQKIAERIGISSSSLYFYFSDRSDMLAQTLEQERQFFLDMLAARIRGFSGNPAENLYGFMLLLDAYYRANPEILTVGSWIRSRTIQLGARSDFPAPGPETEFLQQGIRRGIFTDEISPLGILVFLHVYIALDRSFHEYKKTDMDHQELARLRRRFQLALYGTSNEHTRT